MQSCVCIDGPALFQNLCMRIFLCAHDHMANRVAQEKKCILHPWFTFLWTCYATVYHSSLMRCYLSCAFCLWGGGWCHLHIRQTTVEKNEPTNKWSCLPFLYTIVNCLLGGVLTPWDFVEQTIVAALLILSVLILNLPTIRRGFLRIAVELCTQWFLFYPPMPWFKLPVDWPQKPWGFLIDKIDNGRKYFVACAALARIYFREHWLIHSSL